MANTKDPISLRFDPKFHRRLQVAADLLGLPKHTLCQQAVEAAVAAVEKSKGLVLPVEFTVKRFPRKKLK